MRGSRSGIWAALNKVRQMGKVVGFSSGSGTGAATDSGVGPYPCAEGFNIKGNDYRLVVAINYHYQVLLIKWLGTHKEYDKIDVEKVAYEEDRYADPSR